MKLSSCPRELKNSPRTAKEYCVGIGKRTTAPAELLLRLLFREASKRWAGLRAPVGSCELVVNALLMILFLATVSVVCFWVSLRECILWSLVFGFVRPDEQKKKQNIQINSRQSFRVPYYTYRTCIDHHTVSTRVRQRQRRFNYTHTI